MKRRVAVIGGGWAGLAAAVRATALGHQVVVFEAARHWGGRARRLALDLPGEPPLALDNGQHILIGAYSATLRLMREVGVEPAEVLRALPLDLRFADGAGLATPAWGSHLPAPLDTLVAICSARGWTWTDRLAFLQASVRWRRLGFRCSASDSVLSLCQGITPRVMEDLIEPLCVAALNTPAAQASGQVFLTVLHDALLGPGTPPWRASSLLLPRVDLGRLLPDAATRWLQQRGTQLHIGTRILGLQPQGNAWQVLTHAGPQTVDQVILATGAQEAAKLVATLPQPPAEWMGTTLALQHEAIATIYLRGQWTRGWPGSHPMLALRSRNVHEPAQFVFLHNAPDVPDSLAKPPNRALLAFVASACRLERAALEAAVCQQARMQLGVVAPEILKTIVEKRATFVCAPGLNRPPAIIQPGLLAAGDYTAGPYPATLEGAVRSGLAAAETHFTPAHP